MNNHFELTRHAEQRNQQRGISHTIYRLLPFAEETTASGHARCYFFSKKSIQRMRAAGVSKPDICRIESKKNLRFIVGDGRVITSMFANQNNKRVRRYEN